MRDTYSRDEVAQLFDNASEEPPAYTAEEVREAGAAAGFSPQQIEASAKRLERDKKNRRHLELGAGVLFAVFAAIIFGPSLAGSTTRELALHSEHRSIAFELEVLIPTTPAHDCSVSPDTRHEASTYCVWRKQLLRPRDRTRIGLPEPKDECPQVWIRTTSYDRYTRSHIFELPAHVEIERTGELDQKGLGASNMYGLPIGDIATAHPPCGGPL